MAILTNPLLSLRASGPLAKTLTFLSRKNVNIVVNKTTHQDANTAAQQFHRNRFNQAVAWWHLLSIAVKAEWESYARPYHMTGYNLFISRALAPNPGIYLPLIGGTMEGDIEMDGKHLHGLTAPTHFNDATRKVYVDSALTAHAGLATVHQNAPNLIAAHAGLATVHQDAPNLIAAHAGLATVHQDAPGLILTHKGDANAHHTPPNIGEGHITIQPWNYSSIAQGTWAIALHGTYMLNTVWHNTTKANGDNLSFMVYLAKGTYVLRILTYPGTDRCIATADINGSDKATWDLYLAVDTPNVAKTQTGIVIATSGLKTLRFRANGKHASSSAYALLFHSIALWRSA